MTNSWDEVEVEDQTEQIEEFFGETPATEENEKIEEKAEETAEIVDDIEVEVKVEEEKSEEKAEVVEEKVEEKTEEPNEIDLIKQQNKLLFDRLEELSARVSSAKEVVKEEKPEVKEFDLIGDLDIDEVVSSKELFNKVISKAIDIVEQRLSEKFSGSIPQMVSSHTAQAMTVKDYTDNFYQENPDLAPVKKTVGIIAKEVYAEKPELSIAELYQETAERARKVLGIVRLPVKKEEGQRERKPEFPSGSKGTQRRQNRNVENKMQNDINETLGL